MHRALRLFIATGIATTGICMIIGLSALMVQIGAFDGSGRAITASDAIDPFGGQAKPHLTASPGGQGQPARLRSARTFAGTGRTRGVPFRIGKPGTWGLSWAFDCGTDHDGRYIVTGHSPVTATDVTIAVSGPAGRGITWASRDPGRHTLTVNSPCTWAISVVVAPRGQHR